MNVLREFSGTGNTLSNVRILEVCDVPNVKSCQFDTSFVNVKKVVELKNGGVIEEMVNRMMREKKRVETTKNEKSTDEDISEVVGIAVLAGIAYVIKCLLFR